MKSIVLTCQSKTAIGAAKDLFAQLRRVPDGHDPVIKLAVGTMQTRFGKRKKPVLSLVGQVAATRKAPTVLMTPSASKPSTSAVSICSFRRPCRCGCTRIRVHPHSTKSNIPIWKCAWCDDRKGKLTETEIKTLESYVRLFGWPVLPLMFHDDGCVYAYGELSTDAESPEPAFDGKTVECQRCEQTTQLTTTSALLEKANALWPAVEVTLRSKRVAEPYRPT